MQIKAIIFDLDNTLYDEIQFVKSGFKAVSVDMSKKHELEEKKIYNILWKIFRTYGRGKVFDLTLKKLNIYQKETVLEMVKIYRDHFPCITLYEDALDVLRDFKKKYWVGLITDGIKSIQEKKIKALDIEKFLDIVLYTDECGFEDKPSIFPYLKVIERLKVKPEESIYVGDNPSKDFIGAKEIGINTVRILRGEHKNVNVDKKYDAEYNIKDLKKLFNIIPHIEKRFDVIKGEEDASKKPNEI